MKKKYLIYIFICLFGFIYGFMTHRNHIFPFKIIKKTQNFIKPSFSITEYELAKKEKYKSWNKPNQNYKEVIIKKYYPGLNIFLDRHYFNHFNEGRLKELYLVQVQRHYTKNIELIITGEITVYRSLCYRNDNQKYEDWKKEDFKLLIIGKGCIAEEVRSKKFQKGKVTLNSGGPMSSDPIFILQSNSSDLIKLN